MPRRRAPVWLLAAAASFVGYFALLIHGDLTRPEPLGFSATFEGGRPIVNDVQPGSAAARAGLQPGDAVVSVNDRRLVNQWDWSALGVNLEYDMPWRFSLDRAGRPVDAVATFQRQSLRYFLTREGSLLLAVRLMLLVTLALALFVAFRRPRDPVALVGAWLLASVGVYSVAWPAGTAAVWRHLPAVLGLPLWMPFLSTGIIGALFFVFFSMFPRRRPRAAGFWLAASVPLAGALVTCGPYPVRMVYAPGMVDPIPGWPFTVLVVVNVGYASAAFVMLWRNYRRLTDVNERRRVRVLALGSIVGWLAGVPVVVEFWLGSRALTRPLFASSAVTAGVLLFLLFPLSFAYAILRHRLFDVRVIIRSGVRYALARRALLSVVPALAVVLASDILLHGDQPLVAVLQARGAIYLIVGAAAIAAQTQRRRWLDALDRRFFRERYDARQLLSRLVADIRRVGSFELVATRAVEHIDAALHPEFVALYVRGPQDVEYRLVTSAPPGRERRPLAAGMTLMRLVRVLGKPIDVAQGSTGTGWLRDQLPPDELELLRDDRIDLIVPVAVGSDHTDAIFALGVKRSEEPYGREDLDLLTAIAESLALLLERPRAGAPDTETFGECPDCGTCYDSGVAVCVHERAALGRTHLPRVLAARYRLDRRLGRGGMGTVYAARDIALERPVAAKVIRADLVGNTDAALRFQQEARAAARFAHPHVVTVHDFGVTAANIGFLVMELLDGATLRAVLDKDGRLAPRRTVGLMRGVASAVDAAHRQQLIHRDLKPENIFLVAREGGEIAKVVDFGIAKPLTPPGSGPAGRETHPGVLVGTPLYMAPEQLRGEPPQMSWDLWALSIVLFEMLTGAHPFAGTQGSAAPAGRAGYEGLLASHLAGLPETCVSFFAQALAVDETRRPASASDLMAQLEEALGPAGRAEA